MMFAKRVFTIAGIYGILVLFPLYFLESRIGLELVRPIAHPEYYYGFVGVALAWQIAFLLIAGDPLRYRPMMVPCVLEKIGYGGAVVVLATQGRVASAILFSGVVDLAIAVLFAVAYARTGSDEQMPNSVGFRPT